MTPDYLIAVATAIVTICAAYAHQANRKAEKLTEAVEKKDREIVELKMKCAVIEYRLNHGDKPK